MTDPLAGTVVAVTRPRKQAAALIAALKASGAHVVPAAGVEIVALTEAERRSPGSDVLRNANWVVFVSRNAVRYGTPLLVAEWRGRSTPAKLAAVGPGTAAELEAAGWSVTAAPQHGGGGEALLATPDFDPAPGDTVVIVRGEGGREELARELQQRAALPHYWEVYRRQPVAPDVRALESGWQLARQRVTIVTSDSGVRALVERLPSATQARLLRSCPVTISERLAATVRELGFVPEPVIAGGTGDHELVAAARCAAAKGEEMP